MVGPATGKSLSSISQSESERTGAGPDPFPMVGLATGGSFQIKSACSPVAPPSFPMVGPATGKSLPPISQSESERIGAGPAPFPMEGLAAGGSFQIKPACSPAESPSFPMVGPATGKSLSSISQSESERTGASPELFPLVWFASGGLFQ